MPVRTIYHYRLAVGIAFNFPYFFLRLVCNRLVQILAVFIILVNGCTFFTGKLRVTCYQQLHCLRCRTHTAGGIDARTYLENNVTDANFLVFQSAHINNAFQAHTRTMVDAFQAKIGQHAVFACYRHNIRRNAQSHQIEQLLQMGKVNTIGHGKSLHELEPYATARKFRIRIMAIGPLGIQHGNSRWYHLVCRMMVTNYKVNRTRLGISHLAHGLNTTVQCYYQRKAIVGGIVYSFNRYAITFRITVGYIEIHIRIDFFQKLIYQCHSRRSVHIVIPVNKNLLITLHGMCQPINSPVHIGHQERVIQHAQIRTEKTTRIIIGSYPALH